MLMRMADSDRSVCMYVVAASIYVYAQESLPSLVACRNNHVGVFEAAFAHNCLFGVFQRSVNVWCKPSEEFEGQL